MKKYFYYTLILVTTTIGYSNSVSAQPISKEVKLQRLANDSIDVYARIDTLQIASNQGLVFNIRIKNNFNRELRILNPLYLFQLNLFDINGKNILFPYESKIFSQRSIFSNKSFNILDIRLNGESTDSSYLNQDNVSIPPNGNLEIILGISRVLSPQAKSPIKYEETIELTKGIYIFRFSIAVSYAKDKHITFGLIPRILIKYKECSQ